MRHWTGAESGLLISMLESFNQFCLTGLEKLVLLILLDKLQKQICRTVGPSLAAFLKPLVIIEIQLAQVFSVGITMADVHLNWFHFLIVEEGLLFILIDCLIFLSPFLDVTRMSMSKISFLIQLDSGILYLQNAFL